MISKMKKKPLEKNTKWNNALGEKLQGELSFWVKCYRVKNLGWNVT